MTQEQIDSVYESLAEYEKEVTVHNNEFLKALGENAEKDYENLIDGCIVNEKIKFVDTHEQGINQHENCGIFKNVHVDQWCTNMEGDSFSGFIYANVKGRAIAVPFYF